MTNRRFRIRLLFADAGSFHHEDLTVPSSVVENYERLVDGLLEDPVFLKGFHLDPGRLCGAWILGPDD